MIGPTGSVRVMVAVKPVDSAIYYACTFSGTATGVRYNVTKNALVDTFGSGASFLPGNAAGITSTGGSYT